MLISPSFDCHSRKVFHESWTSHINEFCRSRNYFYDLYRTWYSWDFQNLLSFIFVFIKRAARNCLLGCGSELIKLGTLLRNNNEVTVGVVSILAMCQVLSW